jgi:cell wall-associated NlpC family hydrolase
LTCFLIKCRKDSLQKNCIAFDNDFNQEKLVSFLEYHSIGAMKNKLMTIGLFVLAIAFCIFIWMDTDRKTKFSAQLVSTDTLKAKADSSKKDSALLIIDTLKSDSVLIPASQIHTKNIHPQQVIEFAKTLIGTPYHYASTDPKLGFDCSGFITYVFTHFNIIVPRSSIDFTNVGKTIPVDSAKPGDLILFTGTDSTEKFVGHMGLVISNENKQIQFIHSSSGRAHGVTITPLNDYYRGRYMKTIRIFPENDK